jgi:hypothetical protein
MEIPFNLATLRKHLAQHQLARRVLPEDATARQTLLEASVHEAASDRFKHEDAKFRELGLGHTLQEKSLQAWMWTWHQALTERLETNIKDIIEAESSPRWGTCKSLIYLVSLAFIVNHLTRSAKNSPCSPWTVSVTLESGQTLHHRDHRSYAFTRQRRYH